MRRVDGERGEDREDAFLEHRIDVLAIVVVERGVVGESQPDLTEALDDRSEGPHLALHEVDCAPLDLGQLLLDSHAVRAQGGDAGAPLLHEAADANLEELVQVAARDGEELCPLEQGTR